MICNSFGIDDIHAFGVMCASRKRILSSDIDGESIVICDFSIEHYDEKLSVKMSCISEDQNTYYIVFENVSKSISYLVAVLVGVFLILFVFIYMMIISVSVI